MTTTSTTTEGAGRRKFYHFTSKAHLPYIVWDGVILPSESNVGSPVPTLEPSGVGVGPDVVWLLDVPDVEFNHGLYAEKTGKNEVRFEVDVPAIRWLDWAPASQMNPAWRELFVRSAGGEEAASHWYVFPAKIAKEHWLGVYDTATGEKIPLD